MLGGLNHHMLWECETQSAQDEWSRSVKSQKGEWYNTLYHNACIRKTSINVVHVPPLHVQPLTVTQLKAVKELVDLDMEASKKEQLELDEQRLAHLRLIGNIVHDSVVVHNDEVCVGRSTEMGGGLAS